jgi:hypothetical protein
MPKVEITKSDNPKKKYKIVLTYDDGKTKTIHIGQEGADDFTKTGDEEAKKRYISRHKKREDWTSSGIKTAGFWSRWLLWNEKTLKESIKDMEKKFNLKINLK